MAGSVVTTSIVIQFADEASADSYLSAEIDSREDGLNAGKSSFRPGDAPWILLYKDPALSITTVLTSGSLNQGSPFDIEIDEYITFGYSDSASLEKLPVGAPTLSVVAGSAPGLVWDGGTNVTSSDPHAVAVVRAVYTARAYPYQLSGATAPEVGVTEYPVVVVFIGTKV